jgi:putative membrane protein
MMIRWIFAAVHLIGLGIGLGAVWTRGQALRGPLDPHGLARVFRADGWWGGAAFIWLSTGLVRLLSSMEKGPTYYLHNSFFHTKLTLFVLILLLEMMPMVTLIRWRKAVRQGQTPDTSRARAMSRISTVQAILVLLIVFVAAGMARGLGVPGE